MVLAWFSFQNCWNEICLLRYRFPTVCSTGCDIYFNSDHSSQYFPDHYTVSIEDESYLTPADIPVGRKLEYGEMFSTETSLLERFAEMGYPAQTLEMPDGLLENTGVMIHRFEDPYSPNE